MNLPTFSQDSTPSTEKPLRAHVLEKLGLHDLGPTYWNFCASKLIEAALIRQEGWLSDLGAFIAHTGQHTGRSAQDKFVVNEPQVEGKIWWDSPYQKPLSPEHFDALHRDVCEHLIGHEVFALEAFAGADTRYQLPVRIITEQAWHNLFAQNLLIPCASGDTFEDAKAWTVISAPSFLASPERHGARSQTQIALCFSKRLVLIVGTGYAGEIKKSVFTVLNHMLPDVGVFPMHCSANRDGDDVALFFGMSGTGKTTLSADGERQLIGDDEHGWSDHGVFNFEGGCYAKVIRLSAKSEPQIYKASQQFGTVLENVVFDADTRVVDFDDDRFTENTRSAYPLSKIENAVLPSVGPHPKHVFFLAADAFGVLPPLARLTPEQAMYYFLSGYTAKVAGTEQGVTEPQASFEACFGAPFLTHTPAVYADLLGKKLEGHGAQVWLINTGWIGGPYGVGSRISIGHTRALIDAVFSGSLDGDLWTTEPHFGLSIPKAVPGVPSEILDPQRAWSDASAYTLQANTLAKRFEENFQKLAVSVPQKVKEAAPKGKL